MMCNTVGRQIELVAIDLDGTLLDSVGDLHAAVNIMQQAVDHAPSTLEQVEGWIGNGVERLVHRALTGSMSEDASETLFLGDKQRIISELSRLTC